MKQFKLNTTELHATLSRLSISKTAVRRSIVALENVINALENLNDAITSDCADLQEEGATPDELTAISRSLVRARNSNIMTFCDFL